VADLPQLVRDIRARINAIDLSREQIAPKLGVTYSWLCKFMQEHKDAANPRMGTLQNVLEGLKAIEAGSTHKKRNGAPK
jgi:predicted transcriptional regulator